MADSREAENRGRHPSPGMNHVRSIRSGLRSPFERIESRQLGQHAVLTLPRDAKRCLGFLHVTGLQSDLGAVDLAVDLVVAVDKANILGLGAAFERTGATA